jgi:acyl-CoA thioester hydrolase
MSTSDRFQYTKRIEVRFRDCDALGHVNNAVYATYFETARFGYWREALGYGEEQPLSFILVRVECNYRSQARPGDLLDVQARVSHIGNRSFTFEYRIVAVSDGRLVADGSSVQVMFDFEAQRSFPVSDELRARASRFEGIEFPVRAGAPAVS